jgi:uncharacterized protein YndB with AHSA1/START domain
MTQIVVAINIHRPIGAVFDYVTTPANWPAWHPASRAVSGSVDHSLLIGEQVTEEFVVGGRHGSCVWQVTQREMPYLWTITTSTPQVQAEITYRLKAHGEQTFFEREFTYATSGIWFWILDFFLMRRRMHRESRIALEQLKERLERPASRDTV